MTAMQADAAIVVRHGVTEDDLRLAQRKVSERICRVHARPGWHTKAIAVAESIAAGLMILGVLKMATGTLAPSGPAIVVASSAFAFVVIVAWHMRAEHQRLLAAMVASTGPYPFEQVVRLELGRLSFESRLGLGAMPLKNVAEVEDTPTHLVIHLRTGYAMALPWTAFADEAESAAFVARLRAGMAM